MKVGIIGCGGIARGRHIPAYLANPHTQLAALYDPAAGRAEELAAEYHAAAYESLEEMLMHPGLEAVSVCTPEQYHHDIVIAALRSGKHVLCEKPMAMNAAQAKEMEQEAERSGKILMISHNQRIYEPHWKAKALLEEGVIGKPLSFRTFLSHSGPEQGVMGEEERASFFDRFEGNGGVMLSVGCHRIDLIDWMFGERITSVMAYLPTLDKRKSDGTLIRDEDTAMVLIRCGSGLSGMLYTGWCTYGCADRETHIFGTEGVMKLFEDPWSLAVYKKSGEKIYYDLSPWAKKGSEGATAIIDRFITCVTEGKEAFVTAQEGVRCMQVLDAIAESGRTGTWVNIKQ